MFRFLLALPSLLLGTALVSTSAAAKQSHDGHQKQLRRTEPEPHFLTSTDGFLRTSSSRLGQAVSRVLGVQGSLDDMRQDLSGEYELWQQKKKTLGDEKERLQNETNRLNLMLSEQQSLREEKVRLQAQLELQKSATKKAAEAVSDKQRLWLPQREALLKDIEVLEMHVQGMQAQKVEQLAAAQNKSSEIQARNRALQSEIFTLNKQVGALQRQFANRTILNKQRQSGLLSEVEKLQLSIQALQDQVVARAKVQVEVQRYWQRLSAQASEVVKQKEELQKTQALCEKDLKDLEAQISTAQHSLKEANNEMAECQRLDAEAQGVQGQLNECRAQSGRSF